MKIKVSQVAKAIRKNGLKHISGTMFETSDGENLYPDDFTNASPIPFEPYAACALGQAAYNLNVRPYQLCDALDNISPFNKDLGALIMNLNDNRKYSLNLIAKEVEYWIAANGDLVIDIPSSKKLYKKG